MPLTATAVIPARYASTRFPGKPLADDTGKYLIQHVYERAATAKTVGRVIVATDDPRIFDAVQSFGGEALMTRADHPSGTDRVAEAATGVNSDIIVNVQGDEPELEPVFIDRLVERMADDPDCAMGTLACPLAAVPDISPTDPNAVKVAVGLDGRALYFSRSLIPRPAAAAMAPASPGLPARCAQAGPPYLHLGVYAYRRPFLLRLAGLEPTPLERIERLEQLRALEHGYRIAVVLVEKATAGVDTREDYAAFVERFKRNRQQEGASSEQPSV